MKRLLIKTIEEINNPSLDKVEVEYVIVDGMTLPQLLEIFTAFVKSCGYNINGYLDVYPYDDGK